MNLDHEPEGYSTISAYLIVGGAVLMGGRKVRGTIVIAADARWLTISKGRR